ncbi:4206_t:CDS:1 [Funneliformis geosporum]|nr:4206_t:CDS:1 [Funneliformis geosporum]
MSEANARQQMANTFSRFSWFPHMIVIHRGSGSVSTSIRHICFSGFGSSFQCSVMPIVKTLLFRSRTSANSPSSRDCVSISYVRIREQSHKRAEIGNPLADRNLL